MNNRIKKDRECLSLTQEEFGRRIGSARNTIANYENGNRNPSNSVILSICKEFNVSDWFPLFPVSCFYPDSWMQKNTRPWDNQYPGLFLQAPLFFSDTCWCPYAIPFPISLMWFALPSVRYPSSGKEDAYTEGDDRSNGKHLFLFCNTHYAFYGEYYLDEPNIIFQAGP